MGSKSLNKAFIYEHIEDSIAVKQKVLQDVSLINTLYEVAEMCVATFKKGNKVILAGNGGSAADAQHIAAEFVSKFRFDRAGLPSISLSSDTSMLTAIGNDYGYENLFARQLQANGNSGDIFIGISTSGTSKNVVKAVQVCDDLGIIPVVFTGGSGGDLKGLVKYCLSVPSDSTALIQECHIMLGHIVCGYVEDTLFGGK